MADLLFLSQRLPYPPNKGEKIRAFRILEHLARDHRVHLGCLVDDPADWEHAGSLADLVAGLHLARLSPTAARLRCLIGLAGGEPLSLAYFRDPGLAAWVRETLATVRPDVAFVYSSAMAQYLLPVLDDGTGVGRPRAVLMDFVDVDSDKWRQYAPTRPWPLSWIFAREARTLLDFDRRIARAADASLFVSEPEAALFRRLAPESAERTHAVSNGIDAEFFSPEAPESAVSSGAGGQDLVFTGTMDYWPNVDAVTWFAEAVLPRIHARHPDARFVVVGANPSPAVAALARLPGITVTGRVADVRPYIAGAAVSVAPIRIARGIQNKVLEAMAMAKAVVATPAAFEGIEAEAGSEIALAAADGDAAAQAADFAGAVLDLLAKPERAAAIGQAARARVVADYAWPARLKALDRLIAG